jgi:hypothetical protein
MVDAVLAETGTVHTRVRDLPSRVVVHLVLATGLFAELGYGQVWAKMIAGLDGLTVATRSPQCWPKPGAGSAWRRRAPCSTRRVARPPARPPGACTGVGC